MPPVSSQTDTHTYRHTDTKIIKSRGRERARERERGQERERERERSRERERERGERVFLNVNVNVHACVCVVVCVCNMRQRMPAFRHEPPPRFPPHPGFSTANRLQTCSKVAGRENRPGCCRLSAMRSAMTRRLRTALESDASFTTTPFSLCASST